MMPNLLLTMIDKERNRRRNLEIETEAYIAKIFNTETLYESIKRKPIIKEKSKQN